MSTATAELLRPDLLHGASVLVVTAPSSSDATSEDLFGRAVREACEQLGARAHAHVRAADVQDDAAMDRALAAITPAPASDGALAPGGLDVLVVDAAALFAAGGLRACLDGAWDATRAVVNGAFLPAGSGGRIVYIAPSPGAGEQAGAARAGLENLARTLSVEWARHGITTVTIAPGTQSTDGEVGALVAYLASPAGAYFSGCQLDLRGAGVAS
jgi:NAD(P)-dependent dehydrogenase (short-subunit alcohol dehydrogenase family)